MKVNKSLSNVSSRHNKKNKNINNSSRNNLTESNSSEKINRNNTLDINFIYGSLPLSLNDLYIQIDNHWYLDNRMDIPLLGPSLDVKNIDTK